MGVITVEQKINDYLLQLSPKQKKAVLTVVKAFAEEPGSEDNIWDNKDFVTEIERRTAEMESGKVKGITWEEVKQNSRRLKQKS